MSQQQQQQQQRRPVYTIGIAGGTGAGKSTLARKLYQALGGARNVTYLVHDSYYRDQSDKPLEERAKFNFDHPDALETELLVQHIQELKAGKIVEIPTYDFSTHTRVSCSKSVELAGPRPILLIEGILILCYPELVQEMDLKVFVDAEPDIRLLRRIDRDIVERGRTVQQVMTQYHATVRPMHIQYVEPSKYIADLIVHSSVASGPNSPHRLDIPCTVLENHLRVVAGLVDDKEPVITNVNEATEEIQKSVASAAKISAAANGSKT